MDNQTAPTPPIDPLERPTDIYIKGVRYFAPTAVVMRINELTRALDKIQAALDELRKVER